MVKTDVFEKIKQELRVNDVVAINNFAWGITKGECLLVLLCPPIMLFNHIKHQIGKPMSFKDWVKFGFPQISEIDFSIPKPEEEDWKSENTEDDYVYDLNE